MSKRTIKDALNHAEEQRHYAHPDAPDLVADFVLLADELKRLRTYGCHHPKSDRYVAFVSPEAAASFWSKRNMMFNDDTPVEIDPNIKTGQIHFPQLDGTCRTPWV